MICTWVEIFLAMLIFSLKIIRQLDTQLMKYAEEDFLKILTLGKFLSLHNYQSISLGYDYKLKATQNFSTGLSLSFENSRIAVHKERPLYYLDGSFKTMASINF